MKSRLKIFLVAIIGFSAMCFIVPVKYEKVISKSISPKEYFLIYQILRSNIDDFPESENNIVNYKDNNNEFTLQIKLKSNHFKIKYKSNKEHNKKIDSIIVRIEEVIK